MTRHLLNASTARLAKLDRGLRVGKWGQLQEWKLDLDDPKDDHRHVSHLFALHPGRAIDPATNPELAAAARKTLDARGDASTGWSRAWKINFWARLHDGDRAHRLLAGLISDSTLPNLWDNHPPFQIDGNFGATAGMIEMLVQSQSGEIVVLPAKPQAWKQGSISGIRARGDVTVSIRWDQCGASEIDAHVRSSGDRRRAIPDVCRCVRWIRASSRLRRAAHLEREARWRVHLYARRRGAVSRLVRRRMIG